MMAVGWLVEEGTRKRKRVAWSLQMREEADADRGETGADREGNEPR